MKPFISLCADVYPLAEPSIDVRWEKRGTERAEKREDSQFWVLKRHWSRAGTVSDWHRHVRRDAFSDQAFSGLHMKSSKIRTCDTVTRKGGVGVTSWVLRETAEFSLNVIKPAAWLSNSRSKSLIPPGLPHTFTFSFRYLQLTLLKRSNYFNAAWLYHPN